jgi:uncharacterized protein (DUF2141 family)
MICKGLLVLFILVIKVTSIVAQSQVEVIVTDVRDTTGTIMVALFADPDTFLKKPTLGKLSKAKSGEAKAVFENIQPGEYAVSIIHDANNNRKLDTNFMGIPREGFGFSNNVMGTFGPPSFDKAKFRVSGSTVIRIKAKYF